MGKLNKLREKGRLRSFFATRDMIMEKSGLFSLKKQIKYHFFLKRLVRDDKTRKKRVSREIMNLPDGLLGQGFEDTGFVLSLTSYGQRVETSLPYALYSLVTQTVRPEKIAVYLDKENWNDEKLTPLLKKMQSVGVEFNYCEDLRSYKKLIPALVQYPNNPIITFDDDFYYHSKYLSWMTDAYQKSDKKTVLGQWGCIPEKKDGKYIPYNEWKDCKYGDENSPISFFGCCCCYPPHIFDGEILKKDVFMKLCPSADDIWFWAMEERQHIARRYIHPKGYGYHRPIDKIYEYKIGADGCLTNTNVINGENDRQLRNVLDYYHLED